MSISAYAVIRLDGLPCDVIEQFSGFCCARADRVSTMQLAIQDLRLQMVDCLHAAIHGASQETRRALLPVKRDCFNGRSLKPHRNTPALPFIDKACGAVAAQVVSHEDELYRAEAEYRACYNEELEQQQEQVAALLHEKTLRCGVAVANPQVTKESIRLRESADALYGRREKRLAATLLRYVSRAALKLSPFSTLTSTGLLAVDDGARPLAVTAADARRESLVRLRRHVLDRCSDMLLHYAPWRQSLVVTVSDSVVRLEDGRTLLLRPSRYVPDLQNGRLEFQDDALVRVRLPLTLAERLAALCAPATLCYAEFASVLATELHVSEEAAAAHMDRLIDAGYLNLMAPWSSDDGYLERTMALELTGDPAAGELAPLAEVAMELVRIQKGFPDAEDPVAALAGIEQSMHRLLDTAASIAALQGVDVKPRKLAHDIYHDVWSASPAGDTEGVAHSRLPPMVRYGC